MKNECAIYDKVVNSDISNHLFNFLTTSEMAKFQGTNTNISKKLRAVVFLRRIHSITRVYPHFDNFAIKCWEDKERRILTNIRNKLVNNVGVHPNFEEMMDPNSLQDFNRSIEWLERYEVDNDFIDLLLENDIDGTFWNSEEKIYVDIWKKEFRMWFEN